MPEAAARSDKKFKRGLIILSLIIAIVSSAAEIMANSKAKGVDCAAHANVLFFFKK